VVDTTVATNRRAYHDYFVEDKLEAGLALAGCEVKSVRAHHVSLQEAYIEIREGEAWVVGMRISAYQVGAGQPAPAPDRPRKLLLRRREIMQLDRRVRQKGYTLIPLRIYFSARGYAKVEVGLCRGKRQYDKREAIKERDERRRTDRALAERSQAPPRR
jgi:SsrA-binding protein